LSISNILNIFHIAQFTQSTYYSSYILQHLFPQYLQPASCPISYPYTPSHV